MNKFRNFLANYVGRLAWKDSIDPDDIGFITDFLEEKKFRHGVYKHPVNGYGFTLAYDQFTRTVSLTGSNFLIYINGKKYIKSTESITHSNTNGLHYVYYNESGVLTVSQSVWSIKSHAVVCEIYWDAVNQKALPLDERHTADRDLEWHSWAHTAIKTQWTAGGVISGYILSDGSLDSSIKWTTTSATLRDEDITVTAAAQSATGYNVLSFDSVGNPRILTDQVYPYLINNNVIQVNTSSSSTSYTNVNLTDTKFVNCYVVGITGLSGFPQIVSLSGQKEYSSLGEAIDENWSSLALGNVNFANEYVPMYQITLHSSTSYANTVKAAIVNIRKLVGRDDTKAISKTSASLIVCTQDPEDDGGTVNGVNGERPFSLGNYVSSLPVYTDFTFGLRDIVLMPTITINGPSGTYTSITVNEAGNYMIGWSLSIYIKEGASAPNWGDGEFLIVRCRYKRDGVYLNIPGLCTRRKFIASSTNNQQNLESIGCSPLIFTFNKGDQIFLSGRWKANLGAESNNTALRDISIWHGSLTVSKI